MDKAACEFAGGGLLRCTMDWNTAKTYKSMCDLINKDDAETALEGTVENPIDIFSPFAAGNSHLPANAEQNCEITLVTQPVVGATRMITLWASTAPPVDREVEQTRASLSDVHDVAWPGVTAFWGRYSAGDDPYGRLCVFSKRASLVVEVAGFEDAEVTVEKARVIASAALAKIQR